MGGHNGFDATESRKRLMMIEDFGPRVTNAWNGLRSTTRTMLERAWATPTSGAGVRAARSAPYDPRADRELSQLLAALDENAREVTDDESARRARSLADTCAGVLTEQTQSAEVFAQLIQRAHERQDFARIDALAGALAQRLPPSEVCELARSPNVVVRALAQEALAQMPAPLLIMLLRDPVDAAVARYALQRQATEYSSEEARQALQELDEFGLEQF
jgi:hypothetical protein